MSVGTTTARAGTQGGDDRGRRRAGRRRRAAPPRQVAGLRRPRREQCVDVGVPPPPPDARRPPHRPAPRRDHRRRSASGGASASPSSATPTARWCSGSTARPGARRQIPPVGRAGRRPRSGCAWSCVERPGVGASTPHRYRRIADFAADAAAVADHLGHERFAVVGLSGGGPYALACARAAARPGRGRRRPRRRLPASSGPTPTADAGARRPRRHVPARSSSRCEPARRRPAAALPRPDRPARPPRLQPVRPAHARGRPGGVRATPASRRMFLDDLVEAHPHAASAPSPTTSPSSAADWGFRVADVEVPVRWWHGDADTFVALRRRRAPPPSACPTSSCYVRPGESHLGGFAAADEVLETLATVSPSDARRRRSPTVRPWRATDDHHRRHRPGRQGLDLGARAALPGVRLRRRRPLGRDRGRRPRAGQRRGLARRCSTDPRARHASRPTTWSALEYACHVRDVLPPLRRPPAPDARRGRPAVPQLGPGRHRRRGRLRRRRTRPPSPPSWPRPPRSLADQLRRCRRRRVGPHRHAAATAPASPSTPSPATSCTTRSTTRGTPRPATARWVPPDAPARPRCSRSWSRRSRWCSCPGPACCSSSAGAWPSAGGPRSCRCWATPPASTSTSSPCRWASGASWSGRPQCSPR